MKKVGVFGQSYTVQAKKEVAVLLDTLEKYNIVVFLEENFHDLLKENNLLKKQYPVFKSNKDLNSSFDMFFSVGGDGTMLRSVTFVRDLNIPILGINTGTLGFLATVKKEEIEEAITSLVEKKYQIQERTLLTLATNPEHEDLKEICFALNEISVVRKNTTSMIGIKTYLNNEYLTNYWADGLIVATPTGSTGYSLSCNGPVISPNSKNFVITPIAPHNLNARPMVIPDNTSIELEVSAREEFFLISLDSRIISVLTNTKLYIKKSPFTIKSVIPSNQSFLKTLRTKLLWGEDTRNDSTS